MQNNKTAVVFYGPLREVAMASKSWHLHGEADYFIVTWDIVVPSLNFNLSVNQNKLTDLREFPVSYKAAIVSNLDNYLTFLKSKKITHPHDVNISCMFYTWLLVNNLPDIETYDQIVITRTDLFPRFSLKELYDRFINRAPNIKMFMDEYKPDGAVSGVLTILAPDGLFLLKEIYNRYIQHPSNVHTYLYSFSIDEHYSKHIEKFNCTELGLLLMVRPGYSQTLLNCSYGPELYDTLAEHYLHNRTTLDSRLRDIKKSQLKNLSANFKR